MTDSMIPNEVCVMIQCQKMATYIYIYCHDRMLQSKANYMWETDYFAVDVLAPAHRIETCSTI